MAAAIFLWMTFISFFMIFISSKIGEPGLAAFAFITTVIGFLGFAVTRMCKETK